MTKTTEDYPKEEKIDYKKDKIEELEKESILKQIVFNQVSMQIGKEQGIQPHVLKGSLWWKTYLQEAIDLSFDKGLKEGIEIGKQQEKDIKVNLLADHYQKGRQETIADELKFLESIIETSTNKSYWKYPYARILERIKCIKKYLKNIKMKNQDICECKHTKDKHMRYAKNGTLYVLHCKLCDCKEFKKEESNCGFIDEDCEINDIIKEWETDERNL